MNDAQPRAAVAEGLIQRQADGHLDLEPGWWIDADGQWRQELTEEKQAHLRKVLARRFARRQSVTQSELAAVLAEEGYKISDAGVWWPLDPQRPSWA